MSATIMPYSQLMELIENNPDLAKEVERRRQFINLIFGSFNDPKNPGFVIRKKV